jgi:3',5'-nucleoside bisphosphate phosphatase
MAHVPVDLHTHSTASDGTLTPTELVRFAAQREVKFLGLTDHDTVGGLDQAISAGKALGVSVIPGLEFSTYNHPARQFIGIHVLGYFIDHHYPRLKAVVDKVEEGRRWQKVEQIKRMQAFGFKISVQDVFSRVRGVPGRPHIAAVLLESNPGRFESIQQIFDEYLGAFKKAHVGRPFALTVEEAVDEIRAAGGLPVLAHPGGYDGVTRPETLVRNAVSAGIQGLEVYYPYPVETRAQLVSRFEALADRFGLLKTGGTDFHGRNGEQRLPGDVGLSEAQYRSILEQRPALR